MPTAQTEGGSINYNLPTINSNVVGKGSLPRKINVSLYQQHYDDIFGKKYKPRKKRRVKVKPD